MTASSNDFTIAIVGLIVLAPTVLYCLYNLYTFDRHHQRWLALYLSCSSGLALAATSARLYTSDYTLYWGKVCQIISSLFTTFATILVNQYWAQFISVRSLGSFRFVFSVVFVYLVGLSSVILYLIFTYYFFKNDQDISPSVELLYTISQFFQDIYFSLSTSILGWTMITRYKDYLNEEIALLDFSEKHLNHMRSLVDSFILYLGLIVSGYLLKLISIMLSKFDNGAGSFSSFFDNIQSVIINDIVATALLSIGLILVVKPQSRKSHVTNVEDMINAKIPTPTMSLDDTAADAFTRFYSGSGTGTDSSSSASSNSIAYYTPIASRDRYYTTSSDANFRSTARFGGADKGLGAGNNSVVVAAVGSPETSTQSGSFASFAYVGSGPISTSSLVHDSSFGNSGARSSSRESSSRDAPSQP